MKKKWVVCMIACLMILLAGCNGNTAKETARNDTNERISSTAGNTETTNGTEKAEDTSVVPETEQSVSSEATTEPSQQEKSSVSSSASKSEVTKNNDSVQVTKTPDTTQEQKQSLLQQQSKPETPTVKEDVKPTQPKPTEEVKPSFDVNSYVNYAKSYAQSIGLELNSTATDCWDNPITANAKRTGIKDDIQSRLNRYKNVEGFTAVWVWAEKVSDTEYEIYIGYC